MNHILAKLMILIYGISIAGYVLLDGGHTVLHNLKNKLHHHNHGHHHVEDHQDIFTPDVSHSDTQDSVKIFGFLLFYQTPVDYSVLNLPGNLNVNGLFKKLLTLTQAPLTPPPLS